jgi:glycerol-3-phosphate cytidylyltransferase
MRLYTGGTFDLFHAGHANFLKHCRKLADEVVVCLNTDEFVEEFKGKRPIIPYEQRESVLLSCKYVDKVIKNIGGKDSKPTILQVVPDIIAIGDDWAKKDYFEQMQFTREWLESMNITLVYIPCVNKEVLSSSVIKTRL